MSHKEEEPIGHCQPSGAGLSDSVLKPSSGVRQGLTTAALHIPTSALQLVMQTIHSPASDDPRVVQATEESIEALLRLASALSAYWLQSTQGKKVLEQKRQFEGVARAHSISKPWSA